MKYKFSIMVAMLGLITFGLVWTFGSYRVPPPEGEPVKIPTKEVVQIKDAPPEPTYGLPVGKPSEAGFYNSYGYRDPLPLDEATVRERIRKSRIGWQDHTQPSPDMPVHTMDEAFKRMWNVLVFINDHIPVWGVEEPDFFVFSGDRKPSNERKPQDAFLYGVAIRKADGRAFCWFQTNPKSP